MVIAQVKGKEKLTPESFKFGTQGIITLLFTRYSWDVWGQAETLAKDRPKWQKQGRKKRRKREEKKEKEKQERKGRRKERKTKVGLN